MNDDLVSIDEWLTKAGFDWENGKIIWQPASDKDPLAGSWTKPVGALYVPRNHPAIQHRFYDGFGSPECPRFIADDPEKIYFSSQYDGSTSLVVVWKEISTYLDWHKYPIPVPGG